MRWDASSASGTVQDQAAEQQGKVPSALKGLGGDGKEKRLSFSEEAMAKEPKGKARKIKEKMRSDGDDSDSNGDFISEQQLTDLAIRVQDGINQAAKSRSGNKPKFRRVFKQFDTDVSKSIDAKEFWNGLDTVG